MHNNPLLTRDLPGVGGIIKRYNEDFVVEELPLYAASGSGTHVYLLIEKQGLTTLSAIQRIARALGKQPRDMGYAGLKDAHGVTRQWLSIEHIDEAQLRQIDLKGLRILDVTRHGNKIKLGHLAGNRFEIRIRELECTNGNDCLCRAVRVMDVLKQRGVPNYFGPQRFGARGDNARVGLAAMRDDYADALSWMLGRPGPLDHGVVRTARELFDAGQYAEAADAWPGAFQQQKRVLHALVKSDGDARRAWRAVDHTLRKLYISALQSELFNRILAQRIDRIDQIEFGDIAWKHANGACFRVEYPAVEQPRCAALEISPTGPLYGRRMTEPSGTPGERESQALADAGIPREIFVAQDGSKLDGARRPLRVPMGDARVETGNDEHGDFVLLRFSLPAGSYATSVAREICKTDPADIED
jgi:tRNA pseudouridine13 synthase